MTKTFESKLLERTIIYLTTTAFFLSIVSVFSDVYRISTKIGPLNPCNFLAIIIISTLFFLIYQNHISQDTKKGNIIRIFIGLIVLISIFAFLCGHYIVPYLIIPISMIMFFFYGTVFEPYDYHDNFEEQCQNKTGEQLSVELYKDKFIGEDFLKSIKNAHNFNIILMVFLTLLFCILSYSLYEVSKLTIFLALIFYAGSFYNFYLLSVYKKECYYAFMGFEKQWSHRKKVIFSATMIIIAAVVLGSIFASNKSLFNLAYLTELFKNPAEKEIKPFISDYHMEEFVNLGPFKEYALGEDKDVDANKIIKIILLIVEVGIAFFLTCLVLFFLFRPFLNHQFSDYWKKKNIKEAWKDFFENLKIFFHKIFSFRFHKEKYVTTDTSFFSRSIDDYLKKTKKSKEKKAELDRLTKVFIKLIVWGERNEVPFTQNLAPAEYTNLISIKLKNENADSKIVSSNKAGFLFEKALYSKDLLTKDEEEQFNNCIKDIISVSF